MLNTFNLEKEIQQLQEELQTVILERDEAVRLLVEWCCAVDRNGTDWDDWDEYYKNASYRPNLIRNLLDAAIEKERSK